MLTTTTNCLVAAFSALFVFRYLRLFVHLVSYYRIRPIQIPAKPTLSSSDVTVIIPTCFEAEDIFLKCIEAIVACCPAKIVVVSASRRVNLIKKCLKAKQIDNVEVLGVRALKKRQQMTIGLKKVETEITIFADDDVLWPNQTYIQYLLACFEDPQVGAAGTRQRLRRVDSPSIWDFLGTCYLERRNFNTGATNKIDGAVSTLSGRTAAYRTTMLRNKKFYEAFQNDQYRGRVLNTDDDKFLTRWTYSHNWKIAIQCDEAAVIETTLKSNRRYLNQCTRWARAHWRGNFTVMRTTNYWWKKHPWTLYAVYIGQFQTPALLWDGLLIWVLVKATSLGSPVQAYTSIGSFVMFLLFTKTVKIIPHLRRHPSDLRLLPFAILFSYFHGLINIWALLTLDEVRFYTFQKSNPGIEEANRNVDVVGISESSGSQPSTIAFEQPWGKLHSY